MDKIFVVPAYLSPFKNDFHASPQKRVEWVERAFEDLKKVDILRFEIEQKRATPTIETIRYINKRFNPKKIYLIIGADNLKSLHRWNEYEELCRLVEFVIVTRENIEIDRKYRVLELDKKISSTLVRESFGHMNIPECIKEDVQRYYFKP